MTIELSGQSITYTQIESTRDAALFLIDEWPGARGVPYRDAVVACTQALRGEVSDDIAALSFVAAVRTARIPLIEIGPDESDVALERELAQTVEDSILNLFAAAPYQA